MAYQVTIYRSAAGNDYHSGVVIGSYSTPGGGVTNDMIFDAPGPGAWVYTMDITCTDSGSRVGLRTMFAIVHKR